MEVGAGQEHGAVLVTVDNIDNIDNIIAACARVLP
jgi:hypothetical protein